MIDGYEVKQMAKAKKESHPLTIRMDLTLYDRLKDYCERSGQSQTVALERALKAYIDAYDEKEEGYGDKKVYSERQ